jgi:putative phosphoesterase
MRDEAVRALRGSDLIVHAGDVGSPEIIATLQSLAPVVAVKGNTDLGAWTSALPATAIAKARGATIYILHDLHDLDLDSVAAGFHIVISGHTHKPTRFERSGILYINPGSAGPRRFTLPITIARLNLLETPWQVDFVDLERPA